jgi:hypothetical protein
MDEEGQEKGCTFPRENCCQFHSKHCTPFLPLPENKKKKKKMNVKRVGRE